MYKLCLGEYPEIFLRIWCRGFTLGVCPENEVRPNGCPFKKLVQKKHELKDKFEERARRMDNRKEPKGF